MINYIKNKNTILALIIKSQYRKKKGINFFTTSSLPQQVAFMNYPKEYNIVPHVHKNVKRILKKTSEVLIILKGKMKISFFDKKKNFLKNRIVEKDDIIILLDGGHSFKMITKCEFIEVKQGPYMHKKDKIKF